MDNDEESRWARNLIRVVELEANAALKPGSRVFPIPSDAHYKWCRTILRAFAERCTIFLDTYGHDRDYEG